MAARRRTITHSLHYFTLTFDDTPLVRIARTPRACAHGEELLEALQGCLRLLGPVDRAHSALLVDVREAPPVEDTDGIARTQALFEESLSRGWGAQAVVASSATRALLPEPDARGESQAYEAFTDVDEAERFLSRALGGHAGSGHRH
jgi:hypothetical protein